MLPYLLGRVPPAVGDPWVPLYCLLLDQLLALAFQLLHLEGGAKRRLFLSDGLLALTKQTCTSSVGRLLVTRTCCSSPGVNSFAGLLSS